MNEKTILHLIDSLKERMDASAQRRNAIKIDSIRAYHDGRIEAFQYAIDMIKIWGNVK